MENFYRRERIYRSEIGESHLISEITPDRVTLRKEYHPLTFETHSDGVHETPFKEIYAVPFYEANNIDNFISETISPETISIEDFAKKIFQILSDIIEKTWEPEKFHVLMHSSGYDSRLLSLIIKSLHEKNGDDWLGEFVMIESDGEGQEARDCLRVEGWEDERMLIYNEGTEPSEYHEYSLSFKNAWERVNVISGWPVNNWYFPVDYFQKEKVLPENVQCYTGYGQNETSRAILTTKFTHRVPMEILTHYRGKHHIAHYFWWHYYHTLASFPLKGDWVHPFYNFDYLREFIRYGGKFQKLFNKERWSITKIILDQLYPDCAKIPRIHDAKERGYRNISKRLYEQIKEDYFDSWYGRNRPDVVTTDVMEFPFNDWWGHWALASYCEHLLNTGHEVVNE